MSKTTLGSSSTFPSSCFVQTTATISPASIGSAYSPVSSRIPKVEHGLSTAWHSQDTSFAQSSRKFLTPSPGSSISTMVPAVHDVMKSSYSHNVHPSHKGVQKLCSPAEVSASDFGTCLTPAGLQHDRGSSLSPASVNNGLQSAGHSISESVFTFSFTDDSVDEMDTKSRSSFSRVSMSDEKEKAENTNAILPGAQDKRVRLPPVGEGTYREKMIKKKKVIQKEYTHVITYDYPTLLEKLEKIKMCRNADFDLQQNRVEEITDKPARAGKLSNDDLSDSRKKLSSRVFKNFLRIMSPGSERRLSKRMHSTSSNSSNLMTNSAISLSYSEGTSVMSRSENILKGKDSALGVKIKVKQAAEVTI